MSRDGYFDLSRDPVVAGLPNVPKLDVVKIRGPMVKANDVATAIRSRMAAGSASEELRELAGLSISLLDLVNAVVEEGILPMSSPVPPPMVPPVNPVWSREPPSSRLR